MTESNSLYIHIPFCRHRCGYCDFNTFAGLEHLRASYGHAVTQELAFVRQAAEKRFPVHTVYFGGGTPSLMPLENMREIFESIHQNYDVSANAEITVEVNPGTVDLAYMQGLKHLGANRISMGVQSANPEELRILERQHGYEDAIHAMKYSRQAGFDNISVDLIFGVPYQSLQSWQQSVSLALDFTPEHISLYSLTVEHGTPLEKLVEKGIVSSPDPDLAADMYEWTMEYLGEKGFVHYEISNWAREEASGAILSARHNLQYWRNQPYFGIGAGAHGFMAGVRTANVLAPQAYINRLKDGSVRDFPRSPATVNAKAVTKEVEMGETMMMGLRLLQEGVHAEGFKKRFGQSLEIVYQTEIEELIALNLLEWESRRLRLTYKGRLFGNQVFMRFV